MKWVVSIFLIFSVGAYAYETETHALITRQAYKESVLANSASPVIKTLGLDRLDPQTPLDIYWRPPSYNEAYYTNGVQEGVIAGTGGTIVPPDLLEPEGFEHCQMQKFLDKEIPPIFQIFGDTVDPSNADGMLPFQNWLVRGAIREDDLGPSTSAVFFLPTAPDI